MNVRIISRVIIINPEKNALLLARNRGASFWYPPGGGWESDTGESLAQAGEREVMEECGVEVSIHKMLYLQEFHEAKQTALEIFFLGSTESEIDPNHVDLDPDGAVEEVKWIPFTDLQDLKIFPTRIKETLLPDIEALESLEDQYMYDSIV